MRNERSPRVTHICWPLTLTRYNSYAQVLHYQYALHYEPFVFHCSSYVTIMAKGVTVGDRVCAKLGKQASKVELRGSVTEIVGAGPAAKWPVWYMSSALLVTF